jgi:hypothetical protein
MKKVLLTSTAVALTAGWASAGDMSMSGSISLSYGSFGTGSLAGAAVDDFSSEADLNVAATSASGAISMSGSLEIDEGGDGLSAGPITISSGALTFTYDTNDMGALAVAPDGTFGGAGDDGEDNNYGDYSVAFSAGGIGVSYTKDQETSDNVTGVSYASGPLTLSMTSIDETNGPTDVTNGLQYGSGDNKTTIAATYVMGAYTIAISGDDQTDQDWDASVAMANGDTTVTVAADETNMMSVGIGYTSGNMTVSARQEFNNPTGTDDETEVSLAYTEGSLTFGAAYDSGQTGHFGDESILVISAGYTDGDVSVAAKGTDNDEMEVSISFAF